MSQNDFVIANQTASSARSDLNSALQALASQNSGASAPSTTYANMIWYDTANNILKMRDESNASWISICYLDQASGAFRVIDDTQVVNTSGTQTGLIGDQSTAVWEAGTGTTESLVSPAKIKAAIDAVGAGSRFLASIDLSNDATADFTEFDSSLYDSYEFVLSNVIPATDSVKLAMRTSSDGGSTYDSGFSDYLWYTSRTRITSSGRNSNGDHDHSDSLMEVTQSVGSDSGEDGVSGKIIIYGPHLTKRTILTGTLAYFDSNPILSSCEFMGARLSSADVDAVRFLFDSGNIESGTISMYGLRNS